MLLFKSETISSINPIILQLKEALKDNNNAWRIAWEIGHKITKNDEYIKPHIDAIITALNCKKDGHQRELLKILEKMDLNEIQEGLLFNECIIIWKKTDKIPSVRIKAFHLLHKIASHYPDLKKELIYYTDQQYTKSLGKGIRKTFDKMILSMDLK